MSESRKQRHGNGATGKTLLPTLSVGTPVRIGAHLKGVITQVRSKKKYPRRYLVTYLGGPDEWRRRDEFTVGG